MKALQNVSTGHKKIFELEWLNFLWKTDVRTCQDFTKNVRLGGNYCHPATQFSSLWKFLCFFISGIYISANMTLQWEAKPRGSDGIDQTDQGAEITGSAITKSVTWKKQRQEKKRKKSQFLGQCSANWTNVHADYQKCHELLVYVVHLLNVAWHLINILQVKTKFRLKLCLNQVWFSISFLP